MKKTLFLALLVMAAGYSLPGAAEVYTGTCGTEGHDLTWELNTEDSVLVISGTGTVMKDYDFYTSPWNRYCSSITRVDLPSTLTHIGKHAFSSCYNLKLIKLPDGLLSIGDFAFYHILSLVDISLPESLLSIGANAFCLSGITSVALPSGLTHTGNYAFANSRLQTVILPEGIETISEYLFSYCVDLAEVHLPRSLKTIGKQAFMECISLQEVNLPEGLEVIGDEAFFDCGLTSLHLPTGIKTFGENVFQGNRFESITLPDDMTRLPAGTFAYCSLLKEVRLPEGLEEIGQSAFDCCSNLENIHFPNSLTSIGQEAFIHCLSLTDVVLPAGLKTLGNQAFLVCSSLKSISCLAPTPPEITTDFHRLNNAQDNIVDGTLLCDVSLTVPDDALELYRNTKRWKDFCHVNGVCYREAGPHGTFLLPGNRAEGSGFDPPHVSVSLEQDSLHVNGRIPYYDFLLPYLSYELTGETLQIRAFNISYGPFVAGFCNYLVDFRIGPIDHPIEKLNVMVTAPYGRKQSFTAVFTHINLVEENPSASAPCYDLLGRPVTHPTQGIYIRNGRKLIIK